LAAAAAACLLPAHLLAQVDECNAQINAGTEEDILYFLNEPVGIVIELGAGVVVNTSPDGDPDHYLDIPQFTYDLDCTEEGLPGCVDAGNTVVFDAGSVATDCTDENNQPIVFLTGQVGNQVTFTPSPGSYIRNLSEQTCTVTFDVIVTGVSGDNPEKQIVELAGFASTGDAAATCDNGLTAGAEATVRFDLSTVVTTFWVTKDFSDDNPLPVDVHLRCNTGLPLEQSFTITDPAVNGQWPGVAFVVHAYESSQLDCQVYEDPVPNGYAPSYAAGVNGGVAADVFADEDGCWFEGVVSGGFTCAITDTAEPGEFTVTKYWLISGAEGDEVSEQAWVQISCDDDILTVDGVPVGFQTQTVSALLSGDGDSVTIEVDTTDGTANCSATEDITQSGVESDASDCGPRPIPAGGSSSCSITNTVFFEGIPTLSRYGLVILTLLVLSAGLVGFRRFGG
jgi:hypothetical protein